MDGIKDDVFPLPASRMTRDDLAAAADHHLIDITPDPDVLMAVGYRHGIVVRLIADQRLGRHNSTALVAGIEGRRGQGAHGRQISLQAFADRLALATQLVALAFAALLLQKGVEGVPCRKLRDRHHKITSGIADETLDIPLVVAFAGTAVAIPDQVVGQEATKQHCPFARAVGQDLGHQATVVVIDDRLRHASEERERMDVTIDPGLCHRRRISPDIAAVAMRKIQHEETRLLLDAADHHRRLTEVCLRVSGRMSQRHEHLLAALIPPAHIILDDRVAAGKTAFVAQPVEHPLGSMALLARHLEVLIQPMLDRRNERIQLRTPDR